MRLNTGKLRLLPRITAVVIGGLGLLAFALPASSASGYYNETRVYADSFGNLVIESPAGYKRIVVGQGDLADEYEAEEPKVLYHNESYQGPYRTNCKPRTHVLYGRGFMYGVPRGGNVLLNNWNCK